MISFTLKSAGVSTFTVDKNLPEAESNYGVLSYVGMIVDERSVSVESTNTN